VFAQLSDGSGTLFRALDFPMRPPSGNETLEWTCLKSSSFPEALIDLHRRLSTLPTRSPERRVIMQETANLYGASEQTLYRTLEQRVRPRALRRANRGTPTVLSQIRWSITANSLPPSTLLIFVLGARKMSC